MRRQWWWLLGVLLLLLLRVGVERVRGAAEGVVTPLGEAGVGANATARVLFVSLEFVAPTFSGNGQYARSQVRGLLDAGLDVLVVCARPAAAAGGAGDSGAGQADPDWIDALAAAGRLVAVEVPRDRWFRLDAGSAWREFAAGVGSPLAAAVRAFGAGVAVLVDWSALGVFQNLFPVGDDPAAPRPRVVFEAFRVYGTLEYARGDPALAQFYRRAEGAAVRLASRVVALCGADAAQLRAAYGADLDVRVLHCGLREELARLPAAMPVVGADPAPAIADPAVREIARMPAGGRAFFTSAVRLSHEKGAPAFVDAVEALLPALRAARVVPLMCGAVSDGPLAEALRARLRALAPESVIVTSIVDARALGHIFSRTLLNFHGATVEPFGARFACVLRGADAVSAAAVGMTVMEAAAFGAVTVGHVPYARVVVPAGGCGGEHRPPPGCASACGIAAVEGEGEAAPAAEAVGAFERLRPRSGLAVGVDLTSPATGDIAGALACVLRDRACLACVSDAVQMAARSWTEADNARALERLLHE